MTLLLQSVLFGKGLTWMNILNSLQKIPKLKGSARIAVMSKLVTP